MMLKHSRMIRLFVLLSLMLCLSIGKSHATTLSDADRQVLKRFWEYASDRQLLKLSVQERIPVIARFFLATPYKSNTLEVTKKELPVINLHELDCVTFVENVLALAFLDQYDDNAIDPFVGNIVKLRYRNGEIEDYASRLHYSSDWLYEMQRQKLLTDATRKAGGVKFQKRIDFMSRNYAKYPVLNQNKALIGKIKSIEAEINKRTYYYIPKGKINEICDKIEDGDVVLMTTKIEGLDTSHLGFAIKQDGKTYLLHASSSGKKVMMSKLPLQEYMEGINLQSGIMLGRATLPLPEIAQ